MHDSTEDLLDELASLDQDRIQLDTDMSKVAPTPTPSKPSSATTVLLEATKQAQEAAELAQIAADRALTLSKEQKESIIEINEALGSWRHASRSAVKEIQAARKHMAIMLGTSIFLSVAALGGAGWILTQVKDQAESAKADVLDLLQTQNALFNQKTVLKIDELATVIESLQTELNKLQHGIQQHQTRVDIHAAPPANTPIAIAHMSVTNLHAQPTTHTKDTVHHEPPAPIHLPAAPQQHATSPIHIEQHTTPEPHVPTIHPPKEAVDIQQQLDQLKTLVEKLLHQQQHVAPQTLQSPSPQALNQIQAMLKEQAKQLKIIRASLWKLRQQQAGMMQKNQPHMAQPADLVGVKRAIEHLASHIQQIKAQQQHIQQEIQALKQQTAKLATERSYQYKAPPLNIE
jgi:Mg2+ and Co2+ transporter CorA